ncbi:MAG: AI-2E family transporter [Clostridia bacterium]|nr:AI-2E family transporter [Clostridia bacterium]
MKLDKHIDHRLVVSGILIAIAAAVSFNLLNNLNHVRSWLTSVKYYLSPVTGGLILAYVLRPFARFMEKKLLKKLKSEKLRVHIAGISTVVFLFLIIYFLLILLIPQTIESLTEFMANSSAYIESIKGFIAKYAEKIDFIEINVDELIGSSNEVLASVMQWMTSNYQQFIDLFYQLGSHLFSMIIVLAMSIYALLDRKNLKKGIMKLEKVVLGEQKAHRLNEIIERGDTITMRFLGSNLLDAFIIAGINFIFLSIFKCPYALLLSVMLGVFNFVPTFGPIAGGILAAVIVLLVKPSLVVGFAIFTVVLQQIDGNVIKPVLFGDTTGLSPFWVLVSIVVGGRMFGIAGMVLGVPVFALLSTIYSEIIDKRLKISEEKKKQAEEAQTPPKQAPSAPEEPSSEAQAENV